MVEIKIVFEDEAANGDIHRYCDALGGSPSTRVSRPTLSKRSRLNWGSLHESLLDMPYAHWGASGVLCR